MGNCASGASEPRSTAPIEIKQQRPPLSSYASTRVEQANDEGSSSTSGVLIEKGSRHVRRPLSSYTSTRVVAPTSGTVVRKRHSPSITVLEYMQEENKIAAESKKQDNCMIVHVQPFMDSIPTTLVWVVQVPQDATLQDLERVVWQKHDVDIQRLLGGTAQVSGTVWKLASRDHATVYGNASLISNWPTCDDRGLVRCVSLYFQVE